MSDHEALRRYLFHRSTEDERDAIEQEYFADESALDAAEAEEDALIEDYLTQRLSADDRVQFERVYGSTPGRRVRVQVTRALNAAASRRSHPPVAVRRWLYGSLAAAVVVLAVGVWFSQRNALETAATNPARSTPPIPSSPAPPPEISAAQNPGPPVVALTISPIAVRGTDEPATLIAPPGTQLVSLTAEGVEQSAATTVIRGVVRTVDGQEAWRGNAMSTTAASGEARFEVPADRLPPDDYIVTVYGVAGDQERELQRYFLRVRAR
jgi:hypothetical protein